MKYSLFLMVALLSATVFAQVPLKCGTGVMQIDFKTPRAIQFYADTASGVVTRQVHLFQDAKGEYAIKNLEANKWFAP